MIKYILKKCSSSFGRVELSNDAEFETADDAIKAKKERRDTENTWYEIHVETD